jgi:ribonucleoside-diphosphate reductase alpha chain
MNPQILFDEENMKEGARLIKEINKEVAEMIGINQAARTTCTKPSGNASVLLETSSGIHGDHSKRYFRNMQINKESEIAKMFIEKHSYMQEESLWSSTGSDIVVSFPVVSSDNAKFKHELIGVDLLEYVKKAQQY